ncbi:glycosyltransferase family 4 protein [Achromobacter xylosoxidans]|uniref:Glycosyltransferase n=1 Tax=Alcaligenes xylosoxydans xylosoxydans TaxID=85698 RepID=A0A424W980_ALCXX|nr:glycosyltransferase family 4 protein [Achromobacter xylosoxidans]MBC9906809.1 glycosyltransferase family 4 protein [Achromobacter xylosoxidans]MBD0870527.1 glycosyltransferase family 4 protein [Achromobacter xylosoxidans]QNP85756.1 glycosyltransferase family 4 protein [Achromobacter xylosoxidans]RPJ89751.1 glycosyltransferase [Achromobacter xylosoxidans]
MHTICFVTYELYPVTRGGCGALLHNLATQLLAAGDRVVFLLDVAEDIFERFEKVERLKLPNPHNCVAYRAQSLVGGEAMDPVGFTSWYDWRAYVLHQAALRVHALETPELIEFFDYYGTAFYALNEKIALEAYKGTRMAVRFHATIEAMDTVDLTNSLHPDLYALYSLERASLALADTVIVPSNSFYERSLKPLYPRTQGRQAVAVPPLRKTLAPVQVEPQAEGVLFYGRLFAIKGVDLLVDAAISWLRKRPELPAEFYFLGGDSNQPPDGAYPYVDYLTRRIPTDLRARFHFLGHMQHAEVEQLLKKVRFAVFPNRYESFCYAAHELYAAGVPLVVSDIPGFADFFKNERNCLSFDAGSSDALLSCMDRMWDDEALRATLAYPYPVVTDEVASVYHDMPAAIEDVSASTTTVRTLALVVADSFEASRHARETLSQAGCEVAVLLRVAASSDEASALLFGSNVHCVDASGRALDLQSVRALDALLVLRATDRVDPRFLTVAARVLAARPDLPYVSCWRYQGASLHAYALPLFLDVAPTSGRSPFTRSVMRTEAGRLLLDLFDAGVGEYAELKYLWDLTSDGAPGLVIPRPWIRMEDETPSYPGPKQFSYLLNGNRDFVRKERIAQYAVAKWNASTGQDAQVRKSLDEIGGLPASVITALARLGSFVTRNYRRARSIRGRAARRLKALRPQSSSRAN